MRLAALAAGLAVLAGCGGTAARLQTRMVTTAAARGVVAKYGDCWAFERGTFAAVDVRGRGAARVCAALRRHWSAGGVFWSRNGAVASGAVLLCSMRLRAITIDVYDDPTALAAGADGNAACSALAGAGWHEIGP